MNRSVRTRRSRHAFTLAEGLTAALIIGIFTAVLIPAGVAYLRAQERDQAATSLSAAVSAHELVYSRFAEFSADPQQLSAMVGQLEYGTTSTGPQQVAVAVGVTDLNGGETVAAAIAAVSDGRTCSYTLVPSPDSRAERLDGEIGTATCEASDVSAQAGLR